MPPRTSPLFYYRLTLTFKKIFAQNIYTIKTISIQIKFYKGINLIFLQNILLNSFSCFIYKTIQLNLKILHTIVFFYLIRQFIQKICHSISKNPISW